MTRLYLDSADRSDAEPLLATGVFHGLTTNPLLLERAGLNVREIPAIYEWARAAGCAEIFFQTWGTTRDDLLRRGRELRHLGPDVVVKVPATAVGFSVAKTLIDEGTPVLMTIVYGVEQALLSTSIGAQYVAPYLGRMTESGLDGIALVSQMQEIIDASNRAAGRVVTELVVASLRSPAEVVTLARNGAASFTIAPAIARALFENQLTNTASADFERAVGA